jgi:hypothetical protein
MFYEKYEPLKKGEIMYKVQLLLIALCLFVFCSCSGQPSDEAIQTALAETQDSQMATIALQKTNTPTETETPVPTETETPMPTETSRPTKTLTSTPDQEELIQELIDSLVEVIETYTDVESVTTIRKGDESFEIEVKTLWASKDRQPSVSFQIIQVLADVFGGTTEAKALNFVKNNPEHFSVLLTTYSAGGDYKYSSLTYYDTLVKLKNKQITYDEWVADSGAGFLK